nr:hypothetical protein KitaXyl93_62660 [Kitasatospora sp. Xyl93]
MAEAGGLDPDPDLVGGRLGYRTVLDGQGRGEIADDGGLHALLLNHADGWCRRAAEGTQPANSFTRRGERRRWG